MIIDKILAIDVETTGFNADDCITRNHQILSIGLIVADGNFNEIDRLYCEIKWNGTSHWTHSAEKIHGLTKEYLEHNGVSEEDAVLKISEFILRHFDVNEPIVFLGHNPRNFDVPFFKKLTNKYDIYFKIAHRTIDSFSVGFACLGASNSEELFNMFFKPRTTHNALQDAEKSLAVCRNIRKIMGNILDE